MKDFEIMRNLIGNTVLETDLQFVDCYVRPHMGMFIPAIGACGYASQHNHTHLSYMVVICFNECETCQTSYYAEITSPDLPHEDKTGVHYYCILINKEYFEERHALYFRDIPVYKEKSFDVCVDILKALNVFAFEYNKSMMNSHITLDAQAEIITHWIIRSILGEVLDMRAVAGDYSIARVQHFMELHYAENITVSKLAELGYVSLSCFNRRFKKELGITPIEYLIEIRIERAKILLRRKSISVTDIAIRCGFGSSAHFSSAFQKRIGITPTEYRDKYKS